MRAEPEFDLVGVGLGPANLSLAALATELPTLRTRFFERNSRFAWHPGLLLPGARMQTSFVKDLVSPIHPTSPFSFLNFLAETGRLYRFLIAGPDTVTRTEFSQYYSWVADHLDNVTYDSEITELRAGAGGFTLLAGDRVLARTPTVVLGTGRTPAWPPFAMGLEGPGVFHSSAFAFKRDECRDARVLVVGGGQSGAEVFHHLVADPECRPRHVSWATRRDGFLPLDDSPFTNEWFTPAYVEHFRGLSAGRRADLLETQRMASDGIALDLLRETYRRLYAIDYLDAAASFYDLLPGHDVVELYRRVDGTLRVDLRDTDNGDAWQADYDVVVLCTGYRAAIPPLLAGLAERFIQRDGELVVGKDYEVEWDAPPGCRLFGQNVGLRTHGVADPNLSLVAWRSAVILNAVLGYQVFRTGRWASAVRWRSRSVAGGVSTRPVPTPRARGEVHMGHTTEELMSLLREGDEAAIEEVWLTADPPYQTAGMSMGALITDVAQTLTTGWGEEQELPQVVCAWGKCRVGSTALTNVFGVAGVPAHYQPVKTLVRHRLTEQHGEPWSLPQAQEPVVFCKEMAGPYTMAEVLLNPLRALLLAGYPREKLHLVLLDRNPYASLASWTEKWGERLGVEAVTRNFVLSSLAYLRMERFAEQEGIPTTYFVYEATAAPTAAIGRLFERLGISALFRSDLLTNWDEVGDLGSSQSRILYPKEPSAYQIGNLHASYRNFEYRHRSDEGLTGHQRQAIESFGLLELYARSARGCAGQLGLGDSIRAVLPDSVRELYDAGAVAVPHG